MPTTIPPIAAGARPCDREGTVAEVIFEGLVRTDIVAEVKDVVPMELVVFYECQ
jgi:hypothetical protein